jgi:hypothetical protein
MMLDLLQHTREPVVIKYTLKVYAATLSAGFKVQQIVHLQGRLCLGIVSGVQLET